MVVPAIEWEAGSYKGVISIKSVSGICARSGVCKRLHIDMGHAI